MDSKRKMTTRIRLAQALKENRLNINPRDKAYDKVIISMTIALCVVMLMLTKIGRMVYLEYSSKGTLLYK